uniref:Uncharacterized protein n=1 Tax=Salix viminalis TaxID=40686 RepID=A0A6N2KU97_SALVM
MNNIRSNFSWSPAQQSTGDRETAVSPISNSQYQKIHRKGEDNATISLSLSLSSFHSLKQSKKSKGSV